MRFYFQSIKDTFKKRFFTELKKVLHHDTFLVHSQVNYFRILPKFLSSPNQPKTKEKEEIFFLNRISLQTS